jgi:predicted phage tail protein
MGMCNKCCGISKLILGALLLLNAFVWPMWSGIDGWIAFVAVLMVLGGLVKIFVPNKCASCNKSEPMPAKKATKKRRR